MLKCRHMISTKAELYTGTSDDLQRRITAKTGRNSTTTVEQPNLKPVGTRVLEIDVEKFSKKSSST